MAAADRFEYATAEDPARDYCLADYSPAASAEDKFRSVNLLFQSFEDAGIDARAFDIVEAIREGIGPFRTVFGIKHLPDRVAWEFYFYDYARRERQVSVAKVLDAVASLVRSDVRVNESLQYFMFSLDLDAELALGKRRLEPVHLYVGNAGSTVSSGMAYAVGPAGPARLENFYFFFDAKSQLGEAAKKICNSAYFDETVLPIEAVLVPQLRKCRTICVANKQSHDCIYFSGVTVDQLLWFMQHLEYPQATIGFVREHRTRLDHLLFDVGFDYRIEAGRLRVVKSGYYGVF